MHTVALVRLSETALVVDSSGRDIRNRRVADGSGAALGHVEDLFIDESERKVRMLQIRAAVALAALAPPDRALVIIENVGNLVCPALFDLGERSKVAILSVTEGDDKPVKYPHLFAAAALMIVNKIDLLPYVDFDLERCIENARSVRPGIETICLSARSGENLGAWYAWIDDARVQAERSRDRDVS